MSSVEYNSATSKDICLALWWFIFVLIRIMVTRSAPSRISPCHWTSFRWQASFFDISDLKIVKIESWNMNRCRCYRLKEDQAICLFVGRDGKEGGELLLPLVVVALTLLGWKRSGKFITCQIHASDTVSGMLYFLLGKCQQNSSLLFTIAVVRWRCRRRKHN